MKGNNMQILLASETKVTDTQIRKRTDYTWYFSGKGNRGTSDDNSSRDWEHRGVAIVVSNRIKPPIRRH